MIRSKEELLERLAFRRNTGYSEYEQVIAEIITDIRANGDAAVFRYTETFDQVKLDASCLKVTQEEIDAAFETVSPELIAILERATARIEQFHSKQKQNSWFSADENGEILGQMVRPIENAGVYVPGGKAAYPSSVLMNVIPAKIAGVRNIYVATPPQPDGSVFDTTLVAAKIAGVTDIFKVGGAQAIAALAYGTESIPKVDKIVGPGNIFVALAKKAVFGSVSIDSVAGPSEILIVADETANPEYVAADLLSQAEHDELASAVLVTPSQTLLDAVEMELKKQTALQPRKDIISKSLGDYGALILVDSIEQAFDVCNEIAPEHLEICTNEAFQHLAKVKNAGAIFLGHYTPEPLGDYMAGPNHILPTDGTARFFSPLSVDDFVKKSSILSFEQKALQALGADVVRFAEAEGLFAHAHSVKVRLK